VPNRPDDLQQLDLDELVDRARSAITALAGRADTYAFAELLALNEHLGLSVATAARNLAAQGSWSQVADVSGTTKQAAWSRWSG
jgi:hypothetical protein